MSAQVGVHMTRSYTSYRPYYFKYSGRRTHMHPSPRVHCREMRSGRTTCNEVERFAGWGNRELMGALQSSAAFAIVGCAPSPLMAVK